MYSGDLKKYLDALVSKYNTSSFIETDPISIPKKFKEKQDIEITGFWTAILSWGRRSTIIAKADELIKYMENSPYDFIKNHSEQDRKPFLQFRHRTFQPDDTVFFLHFLQEFYNRYDSLEEAFMIDDESRGIEAGLIHFHKLFASDPWRPQRTLKHISTPEKNSACKRLNMFLRWMVRKDKKGVDFGLWKKFSSSELMVPLDIHVGRVARKLGLLERKNDDWLAVKELTQRLSDFDASDPVKYDYALFSLGLEGIMG